MTSSYPASLDSFTNPSATDEMDDPGVEHDVQHSDANDAIEALQAKVGVGASTPTTVGDVLTVSASGVTGWSNATSVVQVVTATLASYNTTTAATPQNTDLTASITPQFADSVLLIDVMGEGSAQRVAGSPSVRWGQYEIYDETSAQVVAKQLRGTNLVAGSSVTAPINFAIALRGRRAPGNVTPRTFRLRFESGEATNVEITALGTAVRTGGIVMTIMEVRP
jgi:hypothetical protein